MGAAGSVLMANQAILRPSPVLPMLLEVALSSFLSFFRVARETGGSVLVRFSGQRGSVPAGLEAELPSHAGALELFLELFLVHAGRECHSLTLTLLWHLLFPTMGPSLASSSISILMCH